MKNRFVVHQSSIATWRSCRKKYSYRYVELIEPRRAAPQLVRGTIVHGMLEAHINGKDPWRALRRYIKEYEKLFRREAERYGEIMPTVKALMRSYFRWFESDPLTYLPNPKNPKQFSEHSFSVDMGAGIVLEGKIDALARSRDKRTWLTDHKTKARIPSGDINYSNIQGILYLDGLESLKFKPVDGILWNYIRWKKPAIPEKLGGGGLSRRTNIDTMWPVYEQAVIDNEEDPREYKDMKELLKGKEAEFFIRDYLPTNDTMRRVVRHEAMMTAREMAELHDEEGEHVRNVGQHCAWCQYYGLCQAEMRGLDAKFMRKKDFQEVKDEKDFEWSE